MLCMKKYRMSLFIAAAVSAAVFTGCGTSSAYWDDELPVPATTPRPPAVSVITETSVTTEPITLPTRESTRRTAFSETTPELATTTATYPEETEETVDPEASLLEELPKVPISEFTSTMASSIVVTAPTETSPSETSTTTYSSAASFPIMGESVISASETVTELSVTSDINAPYKMRDKILRPYSYSKLDDKTKYIYDELITAISQNKTDVKFPASMEIKREDYQAAYQRIYSDENSIYYIDKSMKYAVNPSTDNIASAIISYKYGSDEIRRMQNAVDAEAGRLVAQITPSMTEYDIVKFFYDYLAENVKYAESENCRSIYGVFVDKKALCDGYSKAFSYLCDKVGIESLIITGEADNTPHMWNMVKIGGEWYHIDVTFAVTDSSLGKFVRYDYFCVDDSVIKSGRSIYPQDYSYPAANSERCNYYVKNGLMADSWEEARAMLSNCIMSAAENRELVAQIRCGSKQVYYETYYNLFDRTKMQALTLMEEASDKSVNKFKYDNVACNKDENTCVIKLFLEYY